jgi:hypothetical protein
MMDLKIFFHCIDVRLDEINVIVVVRVNTNQKIETLDLVQELVEVLGEY